MITRHLACFHRYYYPIFCILFFCSMVHAQNFQFFLDSDSDGFGDPNFGVAAQQAGYVQNSLDCNDNDASINPNTVWFADPDFDGYGAGAPFVTCNPGAGWARQGGDCDNSSAAIRPGLAELCDGIDQNCNGQKDEGLPTLTYYRDADGDGFGDANPNNPSRTDCANPIGYVSNNQDCNDTDPSIRPGVADNCNGIDDNCNGQFDEDGGGARWYRDEDMDGFGDIASSISACSQPSGYVSNADDCNDKEAAINPNTLWFADPDFDGYGAGDPLKTCNPGAGWSMRAGDCDNSSAAIRPGLAEICDGIDQNCNGQKDEGLPTQTYYRDADGDGFGNPAISVQDCVQRPGFVNNNGDCDDTNAAVTTGSSNPEFKLTYGGRIGHNEANCDPFYPRRIRAQVPPTARHIPILNARYQWWKNSSPTLTGATLIQGATEESYRPDTIRTTTWFVRMAYHPNGCLGDAQPSNWIVKQVGGCLRQGNTVVVPEPIAGEALQLFPNPVNERLYVLAPEHSAGQSATINVINPMGKVVFTQKYANLTGETLVVESSNLLEGMYWLELKMEGKRAQQKAFVVQHP